MISYAPFEVEEPQVTIESRPVPQQKPAPVKKMSFGNEGTECNYLIFVFIAGLLYIISTE
jgi:hypothetical protein